VIAPAAIVLVVIPVLLGFPVILVLVIVIIIIVIILVAGRHVRLRKRRGLERVQQALLVAPGAGAAGPLAGAPRRRN